ncbi:hypothetical protein GF314_01915 [bacterium]|nr:hypothetical protein [bacterium]
MVKKILFIGGSLNQTTIMHQISRHLPEYEAWFSPFYTDGALEPLVDRGWAEFTIMGGPMRADTERYLREQDLRIDYKGRRNTYDLALLGTDLLVPNNLEGVKTVLVQEGMTDPEDLMYHLVKWLKLPRFLASTATTGLSHRYERFCVASAGYRDHFVAKGVDPDRIVITGIPNFDHCALYRDNDFPHHGHVLVATSDTRECFKFCNRKRFLQNAREIAGDREIIVKLHPNENVERSTQEIREVLPDARILATGDTNHMIANCDVLITQYSSVVYVGLALGKEVHSYFDLDELERLQPLQNGGRSAANIAAVCRELLEQDLVLPGDGSIQEAAAS